MMVQENLFGFEEKAVKNVEEMSNQELLATLLGVKEGSISYGRLSDMVTAPMSIKGIGEKKSKKLYAIAEITRRLMQTVDRPEVVHGPEDAAHYLMPTLKFETVEHFGVLILNTKNHIIANTVLTTGSLTASVVHPREVFREILKYPTASAIIYHNHPSGDPDPSHEDIAVTRRLVKAGNVLDIPILDHVIIGDNRFVSLKEKGMID